jgi:RNase P subunit RPR2
VVRSRAAKLAEVVPDAPTRCPHCNKPVGTRFQAVYNDPAKPKLVGWTCKQCGWTTWL